mgnify:CR=1 FL=1
MFQNLKTNCEKFMGEKEREREEKKRVPKADGTNFFSTAFSKTAIKNLFPFFRFFPSLSPSHIFHGDGFVHFVLFDQ